MCAILSTQRYFLAMRCCPQDQPLWWRYFLAPPPAASACRARRSLFRKARNVLGETPSNAAADPSGTRAVAQSMTSASCAGVGFHRIRNRLPELGPQTAWIAWPPWEAPWHPWQARMRPAYASCEAGHPAARVFQVCPSSWLSLRLQIVLQRRRHVPRFALKAEPLKAAA
jgi:hypothetical protein